MFDHVTISPQFRTALAAQVARAAAPRAPLLFWFAPAAVGLSLLMFVVVKSNLGNKLATTVDNTAIQLDLSYGGNNLNDSATLAEEQQLLAMVNTN